MDDQEKFLLTGLKNRINILNKQLILNNHKINQSNKIPIANILIQEAINNEDMDQNGEIYGYDFIIEEDDQIPLVLKIYQQNNLKDKKLKTKKWDFVKNS